MTLGLESGLINLYINMLQIVKEAHACSLSWGIRAPSYCRLQPDCSCITADGKAIPSQIWSADQRVILFVLLLVIFIIALYLSFFSTHFIFNKSLGKKVQGKGILTIFIWVLLYFTFVIIYFPLLFIVLDHLIRKLYFWYKHLKYHFP